MTTTGVKVHEGDFRPQQYKISIVAAQFNQMITRPLADAAIDVLLKFGIERGNIEVYWVPGAFEIPLTCKRIFEKKSHVDGIIAIGAVIEGETAHFDHVAGQVAAGVMNVSLEASKPISFCVLTTSTIEQAMNRAGIKLGNKGGEAAQGLLEQLEVFNKSGLH